MHNLLSFSCQMAYYREDPILALELEANLIQAENNARLRERLKARIPSVPLGKPTPISEIITLPTEPASKPAPWQSTAHPGLGDKKGAYFLHLHEELCAFTKWLTPTTDEVATRNGLVAAINKAVLRVSRSAQVVVFGSVYTELCLPNADLDLAITGLSITRMSRNDKKTLMKRLAKILIDLGLTTKVEVVDTARVPILKFVSSEVSIDLAFGLDKNPRRTSEWAKSQLVKFPALKPIVLFLKVYLMLRGFNEPFYGGIGSYLLVALATAFMKNHASFRNRTVFSACNLGHLLFDFFKFFGEELNEDKVGFASNGSLQPNRHHSMLSCESPDDPYLDIGQAAFEYPQIKSCFRNTYLAMCSQVESSNGSLTMPELIGSDFSWAERKICTIVLDETQSSSESEESPEEILPINAKLLRTRRGLKRFVVAMDSSSSEERSPKRARVSSWGGQGWSSEPSD